MIARISPQVRLPSDVGPFDYFVPKELEQKIRPGQLVEIPFRSQKEAGVILALQQAQESQSFRARPIKKILIEEPVLTPCQLKLARLFSEYYFCSQSYAARLMAPDVPKKKASGRPGIVSDISFPVRCAQFEPLAQAAAGIKIPVAHIQTQDIASFVWLTRSVIAKNKSKQTMILAPTIHLLELLFSVLAKSGINEIALIHSDLGKNEYWNNYQAMLKNKARVILSTRQGVFLPIQQNSAIIFFEALSQNFKQSDQHPRYDARIIAHWLGKLAQARLLFCGASILPQQADDYQTLPAAAPSPCTVRVIDAKQERAEAGLSTIKYSAMRAIQDTIAQRKKVLILTLRESSGQGISGALIYEELTRTQKNCRISIYTENNKIAPDADIIIITQAPLESLKLASERHLYGLLVIASIEPILAIPDYRSGERALAKLLYWKTIAQELRIPNILLQAYAPEHPAVKAFASGDLQAFGKHELKARKQLQYPPFIKLIKLTYTGSNSKAITQAAQKLKESFSAKAVLGPIKEQGRESLLLKLDTGADLSVLSSLKKNWIIDRDPERVA